MWIRAVQNHHDPFRSTRSLFLSKFSRRSQTFIFSLWQINITLHRFPPSYIPSSLLVWPFDLVPCFNSMANLQDIASNLQGSWTIRTINWRSKNRKLRTSEVGGALSKHFLNQFTWHYKSEVPQRSKKIKIWTGPQQKEMGHRVT